MPLKEHGLVTRCGSHLAHEYEALDKRMELISLKGWNGHSEMMDKSSAADFLKNICMR